MENKKAQFNTMNVVGGVSRADFYRLSALAKKSKLSLKRMIGIAVHKEINSSKPFADWENLTLPDDEITPFSYAHEAGKLVKVFQNHIKHPKPLDFLLLIAEDLELTKDNLIMGLKEAIDQGHLEMREVKKDSKYWKKGTKLYGIFPEKESVRKRINKMKKANQMQKAYEEYLKSGKK